MIRIWWLLADAVQCVEPGGMVGQMMMSKMMGQWMRTAAQPQCAHMSEEATEVSTDVWQAGEGKRKKQGRRKV